MVDKAEFEEAQRGFAEGNLYALITTLNENKESRIRAKLQRIQRLREEEE